MDWRDRLGSKLVPVEKAAAEIESDSVLMSAPFTCTPHTLCRAIAERGARGELSGVKVDHPATLFSWTDAAWADAFHLTDNYATPATREACHRGEMSYLPVGFFREYEIPAGWSQEPDVFIVPVSPPDENGYCSYGHGVWFSGTASRLAKRVFAEVHPGFIRTYGESYIHVDQIDLFVEAQEPPSAVPGGPPSDEERMTVDVICNLVAAELVNDGDTLQMGVGTVSASLGMYLGFRNDLGIQTELITGGIVDLVEQGVVTGARKTLHKNKVVGSALVALDENDMRRIDRNPIFELYDFGYTDDLRKLIHIDNFVTVNNAMVVDLTGQVAAESFDSRPYTGVGGQTVFMLAGAYSPGGKSVSVVPSSSVPTHGARVSRIVPGLPPGTPVTVPRTYVDYVVTEHGIAELRGKSIRERVGALLEIAHPEFREELRSEAKRLYGF